MTTILTARLLVRDVRREDAEATARLWSDAVVMRYMGGPRLYQEVFDSIVNDTAKDMHRDIDIWTVIDRTTGELVGNCGLVEKEVDSRTECERSADLASRPSSRSSTPKTPAPNGSLSKLACAIDATRRARTARRSAFMSAVHET